jgi:hypothetical protein|nr:MAG TPA: hypothetical protein [Bacteriophage sp.]
MINAWILIYMLVIYMSSVLLCMTWLDPHNRAELHSILLCFVWGSVTTMISVIPLILGGE